MSSSANMNSDIFEDFIIHCRLKFTRHGKGKASTYVKKFAVLPTSWQAQLKATFIFNWAEIWMVRHHWQVLVFLGGVK